MKSRFVRLVIGYCCLNQANLFLWINMIDLTYNRAKGVNLETKEFQDRVTVVRADGRKQSWVSSCKIQ